MNSNYFLINGSFSTYLLTYVSYSFYSTSLSLVCNKINNLFPSMMQDIINNKKFIKIFSLVAVLTLPALYPPILLINSVAFSVLNIFGFLNKDTKNQETQTTQETSEAQLEKPKGTQKSIQKSKKNLNKVTKLKNDEIDEITIKDVPFLTNCRTKDESVLKNNSDILDKIHIVLNQKELNHIVLCGEPGSGKSCLIKVLANELAEEQIPYLKEHEIYKLDAADLVSNTSFSGQLGTKISKMKKFIESKKAEGIKTIIFIDEIHQLSGMGTTISHSNDVWQFLKEGMGNSDFTILGTTTDDEYDYTIARDKALESRLTKIAFPQLSQERKKEIIHFKAEKIKEKFDSLRSISKDEISQIIERAEKNINPSIKGHSLRNIIKQINLEFSKEDLYRQGFLYSV